jgi:hypothetical protein
MLYGTQSTSCVNILRTVSVRSAKTYGILRTLSVLSAKTYGIWTSILVALTLLRKALFEQQLPGWILFKSDWTLKIICEQGREGYLRISHPYIGGKGP